MGVAPKEREIPATAADLLRACEALLTMHDRSAGWLKERDALLIQLRAHSPVETKEPRTYTALNYVGNGPLPDCDECHKAYSAHGAMDACPPEEPSGKVRLMTEAEVREVYPDVNVNDPANIMDRNGGNS